MIWLLALVVGIAIGAILIYLWFRARISLEVRKYIQENEERIKKEVLERSRAVLKGKIGEQIAALLPEFPYSPSDARFLGSPIDYVVFDGYTKVKEGAGKDLQIVFLEVKKGKDPKLSREEEIIKAAVEMGKVSWKTLWLK